MATNNDGFSDTRRKWRDLTIGQKLAFLGKLVIFLLTFGFAYPNLMDTEDQTI